MVKVKWIMGLALAGTALWLATVLAAQVTLETTFTIGALAVLAAVVLGVKRIEGSKLGRMSTPVAILLIAAAIAVPIVRDSPRAGSTVNVAQESKWIPFNEAAISKHVTEGKVVFVDVTADWCITCQFNKARVLDAEPIASLLADQNVVAMKADWTNPDPTIAEYLQRHGRYGIPFNIVYGPSTPEGIPLPELLGKDDVLAAFTAAEPSLLANR